MNGNRQLTPQEQVTHLWMTVFGVMGNNGLYGKSRELDDRINLYEARTDQRFARYETIETQIRAIIKAGQWAAVSVGAIIGLMSSGPIGQFLGNLITVGLGK
jgi:hypothetical protein